MLCFRPSVAGWVGLVGWRARSVPAKAITPRASIEWPARGRPIGGLKRRRGGGAPQECDDEGNLDTRVKVER